MTDARTPISADTVATRLTELDRIGVGRSAVNRLAWTGEDASCQAWFESQAHELGLVFARDPAGNLWACPDAPAPWWGIGSHLDSVRDGGRFDGPLGVVCGCEVAARELALAVISFADEEGSAIQHAYLRKQGAHRQARPRRCAGPRRRSRDDARTCDSRVRTRSARDRAGASVGRAAARLRGSSHRRTPRAL